MEEPMNRSTIQPVLRVFGLLTALLFMAACQKDAPDDGAGAAGVAKKDAGEPEDWRVVEYGQAVQYTRNLKLPYEDFELVLTGTRRDSISASDSVEFKVFKLVKGDAKLVVEWPVGSKRPVRFEMGGKAFLLEAEGSTLADLVLEPEQLVVWNKGALANALIGEKKAEARRKAEGISEEEWEKLLAEAMEGKKRQKGEEAEIPAPAVEAEEPADSGPAGPAPGDKRAGGKKDERAVEAKPAEEAQPAALMEHPAEEKREERAFRSPSRKSAKMGQRNQALRVGSGRTVVGVVGAEWGTGTGAFGAGMEGRPGGPPDTEHYDKVVENEFKSAVEHPLSTFSIDVDTASYSNVRRFINESRLPPPDAVRIEELVNYFSYDYEFPTEDVPFAVETEISKCPWNKANRLVSVGLQGKAIKVDALPPANLVFLLDVSGSMNYGNKLPLLKKALKLLVKQLRDEDRVAITVYAGAAGVVLPSTSGSDRQRIIEALDKLRAGGSTAGGAGIELAYEIAGKNFVEGGNNRVILATDGDFNVGTSSTDELVKLIEEKREGGIFLTVLGFGTGNYKGAKMEQLADKGNGNYAYIDNILEAKKVLVTEMGSTLVAIAKDVKIQIEFNPAKVKEYRLVGYENRLLAKEDFADDTKDAGELGAGHTVTALYEIVPLAGKENVGEGDLKYTETKVTEKAVESGELMTVKLRYKAPDGDKSKLIEMPVVDDGVVLAKASDNFRFAAAVAEFGMLLRNSKFKREGSWKQVLELARGAKGEDKHGYRAEFIRMVEKVELLAETGENPVAKAGVKPGRDRSVRPEDNMRLKASVSSGRSFVGGKIDKSAVNKLLRQRSIAFKKCYQMVARRNPTIKGKLTLRLKVTTDGRATSRVISDKTGEPNLAKCIMKKIRQWSFPKPTGKSVEFVVPFVFRAL